MDRRSDMPGDRVRLSPRLVGKQKTVKVYKLPVSTPMAVYMLWVLTDLPWWGKALLTLVSLFTITYKRNKP